MNVFFFFFNYSPAKKQNYTIQKIFMVFELLTIPRKQLKFWKYSFNLTKAVMEMQQLHFVCRALSVRDFIEAKPLLSVYSYYYYFKSIVTYYFTPRVYTWIIVLLVSVLNLCQSKDDKSKQSSFLSSKFFYHSSPSNTNPVWKKGSKNSTLYFAFYIKSSNTSFLVALCGRQ